MNTTYRIVALLLSVILVILSAVSCSEKSLVSADGITTSEVTSEQQETSEYVAPDVNYDGTEFCLAAVDYNKSSASSKWNAVNYCEVFAESESGDPLNDSIYRRNIAVAEQLNIKITQYVLPDLGSSGTEIQKLVLADDDAIDYAMVTAYTLKTLLGSGCLIDLGDMPTLDVSHSWWDKNALDDFTMFGKTHVITGDISLYTAYSAICYFFNKQLVDTLRLDDPYRLVYDGVWTIDRAIAMSKEAARDLDGDSDMTVADSYGMLCEPDSMRYAALACGVRFTQKDNSGIPALAIDVDRAAALIEKMVPFMTNKDVNILSVNFNSQYQNPFTDLMLPMFTENRALFYNNQILVALNLRAMDADFGVIPPPKMDEAQQTYLCPVNTWWSTFAVVPKTNGELEMTGHVLEAMGFYSQQIMMPAFIDVTVRHKALRDEDSSNMLNLIFKYRVYDIANIYDFGGVQSLFPQMASSGATNFTSRYASLQKKAQSEIDQLMAKLQQEN